MFFGSNITNNFLQYTSVFRILATVPLTEIIGCFCNLERHVVTYCARHRLARTILLFPKIFKNWLWLLLSIQFINSLSFIPLLLFYRTNVILTSHRHLNKQRSAMFQHPPPQKKAFGIKFFSKFINRNTNNLIISDSTYKKYDNLIFLMTLGFILILLQQLFIWDH